MFDFGSDPVDVTLPNHGHMAVLTGNANGTDLPTVVAVLQRYCEDVNQLRSAYQQADTPAAFLCSCLWLQQLTEDSAIVRLSEAAAQMIQQDCNCIAAGQASAYIGLQHLPQLCAAAHKHLWQRQSDVEWAIAAPEELFARTSACSAALLVCITSLLQTLADAESLEVLEIGVQCIKLWLPAMLQTANAATIVANDAAAPPHMRAFKWVNDVWKHLHHLLSGLSDGIRQQVPEMSQAFSSSLQLAMVRSCQHYAFAECLHGHDLLRPPQVTTGKSAFAASCQIHNSLTTAIMAFLCHILATKA